MSPSPKNLSPKKLTLEEIWKLYLLLEESTPDPLKEKFTENIYPMFKKTRPTKIVESIHILFDNLPEMKNGDDILAFFTLGMKDCGYFDFVNFVRSL